MKVAEHLRLVTYNATYSATHKVIDLATRVVLHTGYTATYGSTDFATTRAVREAMAAAMRTE